MRELGERQRKEKAEEFGEQWERQYDDARAEWKHQQELHGDSSREAIRAARKAQRLWKTGSAERQK
jgi:hypothetical protein